MKKFFSVIFAIMMIFAMSFPTFAAGSPVAPTEGYTVEVIPSTGGTGVYNKYVDSEGNTHIVLIAQPLKGFVFDHWEIEGKYTANGKLTDPKLDITIFSDIDVTPIYKKSSNSSTSSTIDVDNSGTSPQTGTNPLALSSVLAVSLAILGVGTIRIIKSKKSDNN